jgi:hypothetical protein
VAGYAAACQEIGELPPGYGGQLNGLPGRENSLAIQRKGKLTPQPLFPLAFRQTKASRNRVGDLQRETHIVFDYCAAEMAAGPKIPEVMRVRARQKPGGKAEALTPQVPKHWWVRDWRRGPSF